MRCLFISLLSVLSPSNHLAPAKPPTTSTHPLETQNNQKFPILVFPSACVGHQRTAKPSVITSSAAWSGAHGREGSAPCNDAPGGRRSRSQPQRRRRIKESRSDHQGRLSMQCNVILSITRTAGSCLIVECVCLDAQCFQMLNSMHRVCRGC